MTTTTSVTTARVDFTQIAAFLRENLGTSLLALTAGVAAETVGRWVSGQRRPQPTHEQRVRDTYTIFRMICEVDAAATARAWFMGMNPQLDDLSPAEAIRDGKHREVMAAARAFIAGA